MRLLFIILLSSTLHSQIPIVNGFKHVSSYDADALAFFTALEADANPVTLTTNQKGYVNTLVLAIKSAGVWTKCKAIYPFIGGTADSHKYNLKDPRDLDAAFRLTYTASPTHSSNGMALNGTTQYADSHLSASAVLTNNNTHLSYYSRSNTEGNWADIGTATTDANSYYIFSIRYLGYATFADAYDGVGSGRMSTTAITNYSGYFVHTRTASNRQDVYQNGTGAAFNTAGISSVMPASNILIGSGGGLFTARQCAFATIGDGLSSTEVGNLSTAVSNFQTSLGR